MSSSGEGGSQQCGGVLEDNKKNTDHDSDNNSDNTEYSTDEVEALLDEAILANFMDRDQGFEIREKRVLIDKGHNNFDILPDGWIQVTHNSGMPIYLHKATRVCSVTKPYFLGTGSVRKHEIPLSSIPCLSYRRAIEIEKNNQPTKPEKELTTPETPSVNDIPIIPIAKIETAQENLETNSLTSAQVTSYCEKLFQFKTIKVKRFESWSARRNFTKRKKKLQRPTLPDGTKLITIPMQITKDGKPSSKKSWFINPDGKSYVCILHEYMQHVLKTKSTYKFDELENAATPYMATVSINDMHYGVGYGASKKQAKSDAAKATLEILIPKAREIFNADKKSTDFSSMEDQDLSCFDQIDVEDPRVAELCLKAAEPLPYAILMTCLQRNFRLDHNAISYQGITEKRQNKFTMTVEAHTVTVSCKNKREGKQLASQAMLRALHPYIESWGSLLRLYGSRSVKNFELKKLHQKEITSLQCKAPINLPNYKILGKLREEMTKLSKSVTDKAETFVPPNDVEMPGPSTSNL